MGFGLVPCRINYKDYHYISNLGHTFCIFLLKTNHFLLAANPHKLRGGGGLGGFFFQNFWMYIFLDPFFLDDPPQKPMDPLERQVSLFF